METRSSTPPNKSEGLMSRSIRSFSSIVGNGKVHQPSINFFKPLTGLDLANIRLALSSPRVTPSSPQYGSSIHAKRHAAVLIALSNISEKEPGVILTVRSQTLRTHPGEISLPGGHQDPNIDQSLLSTALRETYEEIGLIPEQLEYLGSLDPMISNSGVSLVWPYVGFVHSLKNRTFSTGGPGPMIPSLMSQLGNESLESPRLQDLQGKHQAAEVDEVFMVPFTTLLNPNRQIRSYFRDDSQKPYIEWIVKQEVAASHFINNVTSTQGSLTTVSEGIKLWGLSGWIIHSFLQKMGAL